MKPFNIYDILGVLAPGAVLTIGVVTLFPQFSSFLTNENFTFGDFGLIVLVSYLTGNLVAAVGDLLEKPYWHIFGGRHSERVQKNDGTVISAREFAALENKLRAVGMLGQSETTGTLSKEDWFALTRRIYSYIDSRRAAQRVEIFNAEFGMNRGIATGFLALCMILAVKWGLNSWKIDLILAVCAALALYRMHRFSRYYAQALFRNFLTSPEAPIKEVEPQVE
jgi:hypothetical protein